MVYRIHRQIKRKPFSCKKQTNKQKTLPATFYPEKVVKSEEQKSQQLIINSNNSSDKQYWLVLLEPVKQEACSKLSLSLQGDIYNKNLEMEPRKIIVKQIRLVNLFNYKLVILEISFSNCWQSSSTSSLRLFLFYKTFYNGLASLQKFLHVEHCLTIYTIHYDIL